LLQAANQTNAWVLDAAGKREEAQESIQYLVTHQPDDPIEYAQLAQIKTEQGDRVAAVDAWRRAIPLYDSRKNVIGAADAHLALANLLAGSADSKEVPIDLEAAGQLYRQAGSIDGQVKTQGALGTLNSPWCNGPNFGMAVCVA
jgi:tetratricopeptide (TPR) repeat protein